MKLFILILMTVVGVFLAFVGGAWYGRHLERGIVGEEASFLLDLCEEGRSRMTDQFLEAENRRGECLQALDMCSGGLVK